MKGAQNASDAMDYDSWPLSVGDRNQLKDNLVALSSENNDIITISYPRKQSIVFSMVSR